MLQRATVVAATAHGPALTLADEPTSALDADLADDVLALVTRRSGAVLMISHDLALVARHADSVLVMADGRIVERGAAGALLAAPAAEETRSLVEAAVPAPRPAAVAGGDVVAEAVGVSRRYGRGAGAVTAVDGVDLAVRAGEVVGVVGPSGSGKSTLARLLAGMERPDAGSVRLGGRPATERAALRPGFAMPVFQDPVGGLDRRWPLWRTLTEPVLARGERPSRSERRALAAEALAGVGLADVDPDRIPGSLSVGQAQRVAVARALVAQPALLVADEPTAGLDVAAAGAVAALLRGAADAGAGVLVVSHDLVRLRSIADRVSPEGSPHDRARARRQADTVHHAASSERHSRPIGVDERHFRST
jgi:peptide/nickel transport system ATP-binding protein